MTDPLRPLLYGYMRLDLIEGDVEICDERLEQFATVNGFELAAIFHETAADGPASSR
ncbi:hypothetical protein AB4305_27400 [Nocardia sp. 2YAB30]|uniref:hypothetical protein n=1 Tax=Nocardia sp. 2YAB30 TaxID=3233022 RepID=UPI003F9D5513